MSEDNNILQFKNVSRKLGRFQIKDVSFSLEPGYIMGLVGRNGAGKSTLIKLLLGVYTMDEGDILVNGISLREDMKQARTQMGFVLEERIFVEGMSLIENADSFGKFYTQYSKDRFLTCCQELDLNPKRKAGKLSKGEYLKFAFAFALSYNPKLLILDEPTGNFDIESRKKVKQMMREFVADGKHSILYATHLMEELDELADYITFIKDGEMLYSVDKESLVERYRLVKGYKSLLVRMPKGVFIHTEESAYGLTALVRHRENMEYPVDANVYRPTLEEIVYAQMAKEGDWDVKADFKDL